MVRPWTGEPRGLLRHDWSEERVALGRWAPSADLAPFVEYFWSARWDLRGLPPRLEESLPHPCVHLVLERGRSRVVGVIRGRFQRRLVGRGEVFGVKLQPGGLRPLVAVPVSRLTDRTVSIGELFGPAGERLEDAVLEAADPARRVAAAEAFLRARLPAPSAELLEVRALVERCRVDRGIVKVGDLVQRSGVGARRLQRLFRRWVGVPPKWVVRRYRLHEAISRLERPRADLAALALELGYCDQAHLVRDFKTVVGRPPGAWARERRSAAEGGPPGD